MIMNYYYFCSSNVLFIHYKLIISKDVSEGCSPCYRSLMRTLVASNKNKKGTSHELI